MANSDLTFFQEVGESSVSITVSLIDPQTALSWPQRWGVEGNPCLAMLGAQHQPAMGWGDQTWCCSYPWSSQCSTLIRSPWKSCIVDRETEAETSSASFSKPHKKGATEIGLLPIRVIRAGYIHDGNKKSHLWEVSRSLPPVPLLHTHH